MIKYSQETAAKALKNLEQPDSPELSQLLKTAADSGAPPEEIAQLRSFAKSAEAYTRLSTEELVKRALARFRGPQSTDSILRGIKSVAKTDKALAKSACVLLKDVEAPDVDAVALLHRLEKSAGIGGLGSILRRGLTRFMPSMEGGLGSRVSQTAKSIFQGIGRHLPGAAAVGLPVGIHAGVNKYRRGQAGRGVQELQEGLSLMGGRASPAYMRNLLNKYIAAGQPIPEGLLESISRPRSPWGGGGSWMSGM